MIALNEQLLEDKLAALETAAFATPVDAVNAALALQAETARFNHGRAISPD